MKSTKSKFSRRKVRRQSFRRQDLTGQDFSYTDIRGVDFTNATLKNVNFSHTKAGQPTHWTIGLVLGLLLLSSCTGGVAGFVGLAISAGIFPDGLALGLPIFVLLVCLLGLLVWRGLSLLFVFSIGILVLITTLFIIIENSAEATALALLLSFLVVVLFLNSIAGAIALGSLWVVAKKISIPLSALAILSSAGAVVKLIGDETIELIPTNFFIPFYVVVFGIATVNILLCIYLAWKALHLDSRYVPIYKFIVNISSIGGTCFRSADLTGANFTQAILKKADFRKANLTHSYWFEAQGLEQARIDKTYLEDNKIRELAVTLKGQGKVFDYRNLRYLNLKGANLQDASFIGADLSDANLSDANLSGAKLARTQLYQANLRGACLTGAYIPEWGISANTLLDNVTCDYVFMRLATKADPDPWRKPDNRNEIFQPGDFADFITPIIKTLDLYQQQHVDPRKMASRFKSLDFYHHDGIDPTAAAIALKQLAEENPEAGLKVIALDGRGDEKIRLQAKVAGSFDQAELSRKYFENYEQALALPYGEQQTLMGLMAEKDERIQSLESMLKSAISAGESYIKMNEGKETQTILILSANPNNTDQRRLAVEVREIKEGLQRAKKRDQFQIISKWAVRPEDLRRALLDYEPQIVHFSGYGSESDGLALENEQGQIHFVKTEALAKLFEIFKDKIECVFLNACYSGRQAEAICQHIHYVIGLNQEAVDQAADKAADQAAIQFAVGFYDALGAGRSIEDAFKFGNSAIELENASTTSTPILKKKA